MKHVLLYAALLSLAACDTTNYAAKAEASTPAAPIVVTEIGKGSRITLRVPLDLPADGAPLLIQSNAIVTRPRLAGNAPYCGFAGEAPGAPRAVKPATFTVRDIGYDERQSAAGRNPAGVTHYKLATAAKQPGYVLSCQWPDGTPSAAFVTAGEVQAAIGAYFTLDPLQ